MQRIPKLFAKILMQKRVSLFAGCYNLQHDHRQVFLKTTGRLFDVRVWRKEPYKGIFLLYDKKSREYVYAGVVEWTRKPGLIKMQEQILAVQRMQEYIESHLDEEITLARLSEVSHYSPWHSYRIFREHTGMTPSDYTRRLRLSKSAVRLKNGNARVADLAYEYGFGSVDGFQRAFRREFGCNPGDYARHPIPIPLFIPYGVKFREIRKEYADMENVQSVFIQLIHKPERKCIIKRGRKAEDYFEYCEEVGCEVWGILMSMDSLCGEPVCLWLPETYRKPGTSTYVQGVEVPMDCQGPIPDGFDIIVLPAAQYLAFQGEPFREEDYQQAIAAVQHAMGKYNPAVIGYAWDDSNPRIQLEPRGERGYIELRAVKRLNG
ncbi:transcriptional regulator, AraC family [Thermoclostridium caenicola]|uniref:Transcriptional regulator, AraC family n=2 Tax=Thermoclostridium caenicola TaxID=659425 RepID=A0A1M6J0G6_9FIRM|nr:transcriptional regulator, AraC family [Thermoclostridium caenicola]